MLGTGPVLPYVVPEPRRLPSGHARHYGAFGQRLPYDRQHKTLHRH